VIDSHCHLDDPAFDSDRDAVVVRARAAGVTTLLAIDAPVDFLDRYECVLGTVGVHPHEASKATPDTIPHLREAVKHPRIVGIGEIGLDYHYNFSPRGVQRRVFLEHLEAASELNLPVVIHTREAWDDTLAILRDHWRGPGIMHCFSGGPAEAEKCLELGFHLAFGGVVTFPKATAVHEAARITPLERLLVETDAPYLAPAPYRGKRNEPAYVVRTAARLAELRGATLEEIDAATTANFKKLFSLD
jgi:TatD DNase family protein